MDGKLYVPDNNDTTTRFFFKNRRALAAHGPRVRKLTSHVEQNLLAIILLERSASEHGAALDDARLSGLRLRCTNQQPKTIINTYYHPKTERDTMFTSDIS